MKKALLFLAILLFLPNFLSAQEEEERDPFVSLGDKIAASQKLEDIFRLPYPIVLKATFYSKNKLVALINDDIIKEGQMWKDFYVAKIERGKVTLEWRGKQFEITLEAKK